MFSHRAIASIVLIALSGCAAYPRQGQPTLEGRLRGHLNLPQFIQDNKATEDDWYQNCIVYQIYPRSFKDSNGDGIGDLNGITSKLEHIADIGAAALWLSPIYTSPQVDFGYDIANFTDIDPSYGTLADFDKLVAKAKSLGLKVILDFVPNHSSDKHPWFEKSVKKIKPFDEYYVWKDAKIVNGSRQPPNNWLSVFGGSAWEWNAQRGQYYLHQFAAGQPDLNYRSAALNQEMKNALTFWLNRGVKGFRIDAINHMFEDPRFLDEPERNVPGIPVTDHDSLYHIYTKDQNETYTVLQSWRNLLDEHSKKNKSERNMILTEAYADNDKTLRYYKSGSTVPFNFMFLVELNNRSTALDFKRYIDNWLNNVPEGSYVANWVVGNHDNHRAATRFGVKRADQLSMLSILLPGVAVVYNGDEIGMVDRPFTYAETIDPAGCNAGPDRYHLKSRDPERTPYQWDNTTSAGFSTNNRTWLPVHPNYKTLNLAQQKKDPRSHYSIFKTLSLLKTLLKYSKVEVVLVTDKVLGVVQRFPNKSAVILLINFTSQRVVVDAQTWLNIPPEMYVVAPSVHSNVIPGSKVTSSSVVLPPDASITYVAVGSDVLDQLF